MEFELPNHFKEFLESLNQNSVRYLLIGGFAVGLHGYPRATNDIDVVVGGDATNVQRAVNAINQFFGSEQVNSDALIGARSLLVMGAEPNAIDVLNYLEGVDFDLAYERRVSFMLSGIDVNVISLEDLLANKRSVARPQDIADVQNLEKINR